MAFARLSKPFARSRIVSSLFCWQQDISNFLRLCVSVPLNLRLAGVENGPQSEETGLLLMAVPKKKTTPSKKKLRHRHKWLKNRTDIETCAVCGNTKLMNHLCGNCLERVRTETAEQRREHKQDEMFWPIPDILRKFRR